MSKPGRNDPCPCGSGNKFKKCCEKTPQKKGINASLLSPGESAGKLSSLFKNNIRIEKQELASMAEKFSKTASEV